MQEEPASQSPQVPPQALSPQTLASQSGTQSTTQLPLLHICPPPQAPQVPPHPLLPQLLPSQSGTQPGTQAPSMQDDPTAQGCPVLLRIRATLRTSQPHT